MDLGNHPSRRWLAVVTAVVLAITGAALAVATAGTALAATRFPLTFNGNSRHLVDANNQPFYLAADTAWFMLQSATQEEWDLYLDNRKAKGFTGVMVMAPQMFNEKNRYGELPFTTPGHLNTLNERWWARMDTFVSKAAARGLAVNMALLWLGYKNEGWGVAYGYNTVARRGCATGEHLGASPMNRRSSLWGTRPAARDLRPNISKHVCIYNSGISSRALRAPAPAVGTG